MAASFSSSAASKPKGSSAHDELTFSKAEFERRYSAIRKEMRRQGIDCLLVTGTRGWAEGELGHLRYIGAEIYWEQSFCILPLNGQPIIPKKSPKLGAMAPAFPTDKAQVDFEFVPCGVKDDTRNAAAYAPTVAQILKKLGLSKGKIGLVSPRLIPAEMLLEIQNVLPQAEYVDAEHLILNLRYAKSQEEIAFIQRSAQIADAGILGLIEAAQIGATNQDLYFAMEEATVKAGMPNGGMHLVSSGPWKGRRVEFLFEPNNPRKLQQGDVLIPEVTSNYKGYFTQLTKPIVMGEPDPKFFEDLAMCDKVYSHILSEFKPGQRVADIDKECARYTEQLTNGKYTTAFGFQAGEQETTFWHDNILLQDNMLGYNQPFFLPKKGGAPFHVYGNAVMTTNGSPMQLHQTKMKPTFI
ncbi:hypothetical protein GCM10011274_41530 [Paraglaciecola chathamensis]|uniref:Uncharacterized protein n=2 Tax=Paraglaciecola chathamensis TaxID=368405 RepID=A0A8H9IFE5_9ALTE|nr:hypothetical protein GCM10011274_41530 [Paraglaciecola oceanifecundans]